MFENYETMSDAEKAEVKKTHRKLRALTLTRYGNLAWGFVRGFPYRRIERKTQTQEMGDGSVFVHNRPEARYLTLAIADCVDGFAEIDQKRRYMTKPDPRVEAWLANEEGAIPAPAPRVKKPYAQAEEAAQ
jgi:hypothetical protein